MARRKRIVIFYEEKYAEQLQLVDTAIFKRDRENSLAACQTIQGALEFDKMRETE